MSPETPRFSLPEVGKKDKKEDEPKKRGRFNFGVAKVEAEKPKSDKPEQPERPKTLSELAAAAFIKKDEKEQPHTGAEKPEGIAEKKTESAEQLADNTERVDAQSAADTSSENLRSESAGATAEETSENLDDSQAETDEQDQNAEEYKEMLEQEPRPNQLGTEFIVNLQGDQPVAERVILLHGEAAGEVSPSDAPQQPENPYPIFTPQEQQQHQARDEQALPAAVRPSEYASEQRAPMPPVETVPLIPEAGLGDGGEVPPSQPPEAGPPSSEELGPTPEPAQPMVGELLDPSYTESGGSGMEVAITNTDGNRTGERAATKQDVEDALHRSSKLNQQRGVLSGLLFGTWFANRGLRRQQKQESKLLQRQGKQIEQLTQEVRSGSQAQRSQEVSTTTRFAEVERNITNSPERPGQKIERVRVIERIETKQPNPNEQPNIPAEHRLETSAWHSIEVDSKTGKPVENPTFEYGREYYRERAQENMPVDQRNAAAGGTVLAALGQQQQDTTTQNSNTDSGGNAQPPDATTQGLPSEKGQSSTPSTASSPRVRHSSGQAGPIWPWVVALVAIIIVIVALIR